MIGKFVIALKSIYWGFSGGSAVKNPPAIQETQENRVWSLGQEDPWRRAWEPTLEFLPGKSHRQRGLVGYGPWGRKESDTSDSTEQSSMCWWERSSGEKDWSCWKTAGVMLLSVWEGRTGLRWERGVGKAAGGTEEWMCADAGSWESLQVTLSLLTVVELSLS